jgi:uncharacterized protein YbaP (TraB family)
MSNVFSNTVLFVLLMLVQTAWAEGAVWKISKGEHYLYVAGTIHLLSKQDYPLPDAYERAYLDAGKIVFEFDIANANETMTRQQVFAKGMYKDGSNLATHLQPATLKKLREFTDGRGISLDSLMSYKVGMVFTILTVAELRRFGITGKGVEQYFQERAIEDSKSTAALESLEKQMDILASLGENDDDADVLDKIKELESIGEDFEGLRTAWRTGDTQSLIEIALRDVQNDPALYETALLSRNRLWAPKIEALVLDAPVELILVGVMHLVGEDSVLALLSAQGYNVEKLH